MLLVFNATFNNILNLIMLVSLIGGGYTSTQIKPSTFPCDKLYSHNGVSSTPLHRWKPDIVRDDRHWFHMY